jgi:hypothetical protein
MRAVSYRKDMDDQRPTINYRSPRPARELVSLAFAAAGVFVSGLLWGAVTAVIIPKGDPDVVGYGERVALGLMLLPTLIAGGVIGWLIGRTRRDNSN